MLVEQVKTGLGGATGNKGTVGISFTYAASSFCFLCSHFAAGQKEVQDRNNDYTEAVKKLKFTNVRVIDKLIMKLFIIVNLGEKYSYT